jgi:hypothetical protein
MTSSHGYDLVSTFLSFCPAPFPFESLQERVKSLGGELLIESASGQGTCTRAQVPVYRTANNTGS